MTGAGHRRAIEVALGEGAAQVRACVVEGVQAAGGRRNGHLLARDLEHPHRARGDICLPADVDSHGRASPFPSRCPA